MKENKDKCRKVVIRNTKNGEVLEFESRTAMAKYFNCSAMAVRNFLLHKPSYTFRNYEVVEEETAALLRRKITLIK